MNRLRELRQEKKLSQKAIAEMLAINEKTVSRWENGESQIKPEKAQQLADYFGVSVGYLLGYEPYPPELINSMELEELYTPSVSSGNEQEITERYLLFITDNEKIQDLKTDTLVTLQLLKKIRNKLTHENLRPNTRAWEIEKTVIQLTDLLETIEQREKELTTPDH